MRIKKNTANTIIVIGLLIMFSISVYRISRNAQLTKLINEQNDFCGQLSNELNTLDADAKDCYCYFEGFKTGDETIDSETVPSCVCNCNVNGTRVSVGILQPRA